MINNHKLYIIVATDENNGIGKNGKMPWNLKDELKHFQAVTTKTKDSEKQNMVIMGRTTWYSIPEKHRPLKNRRNIVLTRESETNTKDVTFCNSMDEALGKANENTENIFIMGGASVYKQAIENNITDGIFVTRLHKEYDCDTFFPEIPPRFDQKTSLGKGTEGGIDFEYLLYECQA